MKDLGKRKAETEDRLAEERSKNAKAALDGGKTNYSSVASLEAELEALEAAEGEQVRRERADAAKRQFAVRADMCRELRDWESKRLQAVADAQTATRDLVAALSRALAVQENSRKAAHSITGKRIPTAFAQRDFIIRLSNRIGSVFKTIPGHRSRFGYIDWPATVDFYKPNDDWKAKEEAILKPDIETITQGN